jgi:hypothetical protein
LQKNEAAKGGIKGKNPVFEVGFFSDTSNSRRPPRKLLLSAERVSNSPGHFILEGSLMTNTVHTVSGAE